MQQPRQGRNFEASCSKVNSDVISGRPGQLRHSSRPWAGRSTNIRIECSAATRKPAHHRQRPAFKLDGVPEHEVQELLKFKMFNGRPYVLVRWTGLDAAGDTWEPLDNLTNCEGAIAAFEQANGRSLPRPAPPPPNGTAVTPPPIEPTGFTVEAAPPGDLGAALVGRTVLYWWPDDGWQRGTVARLCPRGAFSHVVAYNRQTSVLRGTADTLLDAASYGSRWVLLSPAPAAGVARALRPRAPRP